MVGIAQLVEPRIVIPVVVGSSPIIHPIQVVDLSLVNISIKARLMRAFLIFIKTLLIIKTMRPISEAAVVAHCVDHGVDQSSGHISFQSNRSGSTTRHKDVD
jgi:hypothetical protein